MGSKPNTQTYSFEHALGLTLRAVDEPARKATFTAATEDAVETYMGREYLKMDGGKLDRYQRNPVVLDSHNRWAGAAVVGRAEARIEGGALSTTVTFAETDEAETIWSLVRGNFLRALSVGFLPLTVQVIGEGEAYKLGDKDIVGPARVVTAWELYEISIVSVPADPGALRRCAQCARTLDGTGVTSTSAENKEQSMPDEKPKDSAAPAPAAKTEERSVSPPPEVPAEVELRIATASAAQIRLLAGTSEPLKALAERCILEGISVSDARQRMLDSLTTAAKPVGTPEPAPITRRETKTETKTPTKVADISDELFVRAIGG